MGNYEYILFDLDGTLTDSAEGIINSVTYVLKQYGIKVEDRTELYPFIGPPLIEAFERYAGFSAKEAQKAAETYREYYREKGIFENIPYEGIENLLKQLKKAGKTLIVATSKPEVFAMRILEHFHLADYFTCIAGSQLDGSRVKKDEVIRYALESARISDCSAAVMVGDRKHDVLGAKKEGIRCIGVLYGYGDREELESAGADFIVDTVDDLAKILLP